MHLDLSRHINDTLARLGVGPDATLVAAVSGGADSMAMLAALSREPTLGKRTIVGHVDHALRPESAAEARFVAEACARWNIPFHLKRLTPAASPAGNLADRLRRERYAFLLGLVPPDGVLLTAHHADDQATTMLMRLIEGAALPGLAGIRERRDNIVRPLLAFTHDALVAWLREQGLSWCEDPSNAHLEKFRNRVRLRVLPRLEKERPGVAPRMARIAERLRQDDEALREMARDRLAQARFARHWVEIPLEGQTHPAVLRRMVEEVLRRHWPACAGAPLSDDVARVFELKRRVNLPGRLTLRACADLLVIEDSTGENSGGENSGRGGSLAQNIMGKNVHHASAGRKLSYQVEVAAPGTHELPRGEVRIDSLPATPMLLRPWQPGDRLAKSSRKVADELASRKLAPWRRTAWPVLARGPEVVAVAVAADAPDADKADFVFKDVLFTGLFGLK